MPVVPWDLHYDRRLDDEFLEHFKPGGIASSLASYARSAPYPLDLQFSRDPKGAQQHVTLYAGLTAVLNVVRAGEGFRLSAHPTWARPKYHWSPDWQSARDLDWWKLRWRRSRTVSSTWSLMRHGSSRPRRAWSGPLRR